jgi:hypothetical protein
MSTRAEAARAKAGRLAQRRALEEEATKPAGDSEERRPPVTPPPERVERTKKVRISLDLAPQLYRDFSTWTDHAAEALGRSRITHADTLRVLVRHLLADPELSAAVVEDLRSQ